jgi:hypothetical protein
MPLMRLLVIADGCLLVVLLVLMGILGLVQRHDRQRKQEESRGRHEQPGRHEQRERQGRHRGEGDEGHGVRRTVELGQAGGRSVAELREREGAEGMRYYPKGEA